MTESRKPENEARAAARAAAKDIRSQQNKNARRTKALIQIGLGVLILAVIAAVVAVMLTAFKPAGPGPLNMGSDGIRITQGLVANPTDAIPADGKPTAQPENAEGVVEITIFIDYLCPICGEFEKENASVIQELIESGAATVEFRPLAILNNQSQGTRVFDACSDAAACVANYSPNSFFDFNALLFENQPQEGTTGLDDGALLAFAAEAGVSELAKITTCIDDQEFKAWTKSATERALSGEFVGNNFSIANVTGTPTVLINGEQFGYSYPFSKDEFLQAVMAAAGQQFSESE